MYLALHRPILHGEPAAMHRNALQRMKTVTVTVKLFATLRKDVPHYDPKKGVEVVLSEGGTLYDLIVNLGLANGDSSLFFVNGVSRILMYQLSDFDQVSIFLPAGGD